MSADPQSQLAESYDAIPFPADPVRASHPDRLHVIGRLCGLDSASPDRCRVLELGCAGGGNLVPMAAGLPGSQLVGVDLSAAQVTQAQATIAALGLENVEVLQADLRAFAPPQPFDYVVAQGVFSWIDPADQPRLLERIRACLAPQGVAYLSYNTLPGWGARGLLRDMMRFHAGPVSDPRRRLEQARHLLDYLSGLLPGSGTPYEALLTEEIERARAAGDGYLAHDHLELFNEPRYLHEVVGLARAAGLRYLGESTRVDLPRTLVPERGLDRDSEAFVRLLQYEDYATNRRFRASLFVRDDAAPRAVPDPAVIAPWWIEPLGAPDRDPRELVADLDPAALGRLRHELGDGDGRAAGELDLALLPAALAAYLTQEVELWPRALPLTCEVRERPRTSPLIQLQADQGRATVTNLRHEPVPVDNFDRRLLVRLDGARDLAALVPAMIEAVQAGDLEVTRDGAPMQPAELAEVFAIALPQRLRSFAARGFLSAD